MMMQKEELLAVSGGGWLQVAGVIAGVVTFIIGFVDGIFRPLACHK